MMPPLDFLVHSKILKKEKKKKDPTAKREKENNLT